MADVPMGAARGPNTPPRTDEGLRVRDKTLAQVLGGTPDELDVEEESDDSSGWEPCGFGAQYCPVDRLSSGT